MTTYRAASLIKQWHYQRLNQIEKKFIDEILEYGGDGSENPSDQVLTQDNQITPRMIDFVWKIAKRFLITPSTKE